MHINQPTCPKCEFPGLQEIPGVFYPTATLLLLQCEYCGHFQHSGALPHIGFHIAYKATSPMDGGDTHRTNRDEGWLSGDCFNEVTEVSEKPDVPPALFNISDLEHETIETLTASIVDWIVVALQLLNAKPDSFFLPDGTRYWTTHPDIISFPDESRESDIISVETLLPIGIPNAILEDAQRAFLSVRKKEAWQPRG